MFFYKQAVMYFVYVLLVLLTLGSAAVIADTTDEAAVKAALRAEWDKPNHPLKVPVVIVRGEFAIADWIQAPRGGRALLRENHHQWQTLLCGDVNLTKQKHLMDAGVPAADAEYLSAALLAAEMNLTAEDKTLVNSFKGIVDLLKEPQHHAH